MLKTMLVQKEPDSPEYVDECKIDPKLNIAECVRLHFFAARIENEEEIKTNAGSYCGYCDLRSDGTIAKCHITRRVIIKPDTYAYLACQFTEVVTLPNRQKLHVTGFSHVEKNGRGLMCAQAAIANVVQYWNSVAPKTFTVTTAAAITQAVGISEDLLRSGDFEGLNFAEVQQFFASEGCNCYAVAYGKSLAAETDEDEKQRRKEEDDAGSTIYGFVESGYPVIVVVKTARGKPHALTVVGHTFDKNVWLAFADPFYFDKPLTGSGGYHSNLAWIRYFIVQDDNLGPYFFVPRVNLARFIQGIIVPLPFPDKPKSPKTAERAAFTGLAEWVKRGDLVEDKMLGANRLWLRMLREHFDPKDGEGWVLRPFLVSKEKLARMYQGHEFGSLVTDRLNKAGGTIFWVVELSWPNLYCYNEAKVGEIIIEAISGSVWSIHVPGVIAFSDSHIEYAKSEDPPSRCRPSTTS